MKRKLDIVGNTESVGFESANCQISSESKSLPILRVTRARFSESEPTDEQEFVAENRYQFENQIDQLAVEEPLEIRLAFGPASNRHSTSLSITMRTPGDDFHLAMGFLVSEGIVQKADQIEAIKFCGPEIRPGESNIVKLTLAQEVDFSLGKVQRHFYTTSSCGICGKASLDAVELAGLHPVSSRLQVTPKQIMVLPDRLREAQAVFKQTGGLHASGVFFPDGSLEFVCEDVGRHNALDKILGIALESGHLPWSDRILVVSGRASFELVQKAVAAGFEMMVAVGAPSSLAVDLAERFGLTLIGFASQSRFNVYSHQQRICQTGFN